MRYRATVSFAGEVSMCENEVCVLDEQAAKPLVECGYLVVVEPKKRGKQAEK